MKKQAHIRIGMPTDNIISPTIYGAFVEHIGRCIYDGIYVGEDSSIPNIRGMRKSIIEAFSEIRLPILRWPGGCFASFYHWKDGIGPKDSRPRYENNNMWHTIEDNSFGTHEFMDFCEMIGAEPYIAGNIASGTVREMSDWLEYLTHPYDTPMTRLRKQNGRQKPWKVKYWGIGNEAWGQDGNMRPDYYCDVARQYSGFCSNFGGQQPLFKVFVGPHWDDYEWTDYVMNVSYPYQPSGHWGKDLMQGLSIHAYTYAGDFLKASPDVDYPEENWGSIMRGSEIYDDLITNHSKIMDKSDPEKNIKIVFDEWGTWFAKRFGYHEDSPFENTWYLEQQSTIRDAVFAARTFDVFNKHCDRVEIAAIAQAVNVLQSLVITEGADTILTPTYHIFKMYMPHRNALLLNVELESDKYSTKKGETTAISVSASESNDYIFITLSNACKDNHYEISIDIPQGFNGEIYSEILTSKTLKDFNSFENPDLITPLKFSGYTHIGNIIKVAAPAHSVISLKISK